MSLKADTMINESDIDAVFDSIYSTILSSIQKSVGQGSTSISDSVIDKIINILKHSPLIGCSYIKLPK